MLNEKPTKSQLLADLTTHPGYKLLMDDIFGTTIEASEKQIWDSNSPEERVARVEMVAHWKALMKVVNAKISNTLKDAKQQDMKGKQNVQETQRPGRR